MFALKTCRHTNSAGGGRWDRLPGRLAHPQGRLYNPDGPAAKGGGAHGLAIRLRP